MLDELAQQEKTNLSVIANDASLPGKGIGKLVDREQIARLTASHIGLNTTAQQQMMSMAMSADTVHTLEAGRSVGGMATSLTGTGIPSPNSWFPRICAPTELTY